MSELLELLNKTCPNIDFSRNDLISSGVIDSLCFVKLVTAIENHYSIEIDIMNIEPEDFESADNILALVNKYINQDEQ